MRVHLRLIAAACMMLFPLMSAFAGEADKTPDELVKALGAEDFAQREAAHAKLLQLGKAAIPAVRAGLQNEDVEIKHRCGLLMVELAWHTADAPKSWAEVLPKDALLYVSIPDVPGTVDRFEKSRLGRFISSWVFSAFWKATRIEERGVKSAMDLLRGQVDDLCGETAFAWSDFNFNDDGWERSAFFWFIGHKDPSALLKDADKKFDGRLLDSDEFKRGKIEGAGPLFTSIIPDRGEASFGPVPGALLIYHSERSSGVPLREVLKSWRTGATDAGLARQEKFKSFRERNGSADLAAFFDSEQLWETLKKNDEGKIKSLDLWGVTAVTSIEGAIKFRADGLIEERVAFQVPGKRTGLVKMLSIEPLGEAAGLSLVPPEAVAASHTKIDPKTFMEDWMFLAAEGKKEEIDELKKGFREDTGATMEDTASWMTGEALAMVFLDDGGFAYVLGAGAKDADRLLAFNKNNIEKHSAGERAWKSEKAGGREVYWYALKDGEEKEEAEMTDPVRCAFATDKFVFISNSAEALKKVAEHIASGKAGTAAESAKKLRAGYAQQAGMVAWVNAPRILGWLIKKANKEAENGAFGSDDFNKALAALPPPEKLFRGWTPTVITLTSTKTEIQVDTVGTIPTLTGYIPAAGIFSLRYFFMYGAFNRPMKVKGVPKAAVKAIAPAQAAPAPLVIPQAK
jgi:hypothetical protein